MKTLQKYYYIFLIFPVISCQQVTVVINGLPENTPQNSEIQIAGNFNFWDPGDPNFTLKRHDQGFYFLTLPPGTGDIDFLFTRGDWTTVEGDICGNTIAHHTYSYGDNDTIKFEIKSWVDLGPTRCPRVTFLIESIPDDTPLNDDIYITGNFNSWNPGSELFTMEKNDSSEYYYTIELDSTYRRIEYKFTRGDWNRVEVDQNGREFPFRQFEYGNADTIRIRIPNWSDFSVEKVKYVKFIIEKLPENTPGGDHIFMVGTFNNWYPRDKNFELTKLPDGRYYISIPQKSGSMEYKFTRGSWETVEGASLQKPLDNRVFEYGSADTIRLSIDSWVDIGRVD